MEFDFQIEGLSDLTAQLQNLEKLGKQKQLTQNALFHASKEMFDEIKQQAPKAEKAYYRYYRGSVKARLSGNPQNSRKLMRPGNLRKNIARKRIRVNGGVAIGIWIKPKAFYFRFIEYGTPTIRAVPFIRPAYDRHKEEAVSRFKEKYGEYIASAFLKRAIALEGLDSVSE